MMQSSLQIGMLEKHRDHIRRHLDKLVGCTNYSRIAAECISLGIISSQMLRIIENLNGERLNLNEDDARYQQHRSLFEKITHRGPNAYNQLITALRNVKSIEAAKLLESVDESPSLPGFISISEQRNSSRRSADIVDTPSPSHLEGACVSKKQYNEPLGPLKPYDEPVQKVRNVIKSDRIHTDDVVGTYKMQSRHNRGVLLMVNIIDFPDPKRKRNGAEVDSNSLIDLFREMGFTIFAYRNMNQQQFFDVLGQVTSSKYVQETECFVMVLMTHGNRVDEIDKVEFCDGSVVDMQKIKSHFQAHITPYLVQKPKVLIFPFCRGDHPDLGKPNNQYDSMAPTAWMLATQEQPKVETEGSSYIYSNVPTLSDTLVCYANTPGYVTHRDPESGSWYIQKFCNIMAELAHNTPVEDILKKTHATVGNMRTMNGSMQTGAFDNLGFNKKLYFNPGYYSEE